MEQKILTSFLKKVMMPKLNEELLLLEKDFQLNRENLTTYFHNEFSQLCLKLIELQNKGSIGEVGYISFTLLRTQLLEKNFRYKVIAYDKDWLLNDGIDIGWLDVNFAYTYLKNVWDMVSFESKKYVGKFNEPLIEVMIATTFHYFHEYVLQYLRFGIMEFVLIKEFLAINRMEEFCIYTGELFEKIDIIYKENRAVKGLYHIKEQVEENQSMVFQDLKGVELFGINFSVMDLAYADFCGNELEGAGFSSCNLQGTKFIGCNLRGANFIGSVISEVDFRYADLTEAIFIFAECKYGIDNELTWRKAGYLPARFYKTNLTGVNFMNAHLQGIDFSNAILSDTNFKGAVMKDCKFLATQLDQVQLSEEQLKGILVIT